MSWQPGSLAIEACLNVLSSRWRTIGLVLALGAVLGVLVTLELRDARDLRQFQLGFERSGGYVAIGVPDEAAPNTAARCEAMNGQSGIIAAGSISSPSPITFKSSPGTTYQRAAVTWGALRVWDPAATLNPGLGPQAFVGPSLAAESGLREGLYAALPGEEPVPVTGVLNVDRRNATLSRWLLVPVPPVGSATECWVEFERGAYTVGTSALAAQLTTADEEAVTRPYLRGDAFRRDPAAEFANRPQRNGWLAGGGLMVGMIALTSWFRRAELGLYLAIGTPRTTLMVLLAWESLFVIAASILIAVAYGFAVDAALRHSAGWSEFTIVARTVGSAALLALALAPVAAISVVRGSIADLLKER